MEAPTNETPADFARRRLREGASDAEIRLELLDRGVDADGIADAMKTAAPRKRVHLPLLLAGLGVTALGALLFFLRARQVIDTGGGSMGRLPLLVCAVGAVLVGRGLMPR